MLSQRKFQACPVSEESKAGEAARAEGSGERMLEPSKDPRQGASAGVRTQAAKNRLGCSLGCLISGSTSPRS